MEQYATQYKTMGNDMISRDKGEAKASIVTIVSVMHVILYIVLCNVVCIDTQRVLKCMYGTGGVRHPDIVGFWSSLLTASRYFVRRSKVFNIYSINCTQ